VTVCECFVCVSWVVSMCLNVCVSCECVYVCDVC
jgi:hypothetical protein